MSKSTMSNKYSTLAKEFGCSFRIGRWGVKFLARDPNGKIYKLINLMPLDGWITEPIEVNRIMKERGLEL